LTFIISRISKNGANILMVKISAQERILIYKFFL